jgi:hypothetical protein
VPAVILSEQRVEQRVDTTHPCLVPALQWLTEAPPIMTAPNPTARCVLKLTRWTHLQHTCNNTPGSIPAITRAPSTWQQVPAPLMPAPTPPTPRRSPRTTTPGTAMRIPRVQVQRIQGGINHAPLISSQEAINFLTECVGATSPNIFTPTKICPKTMPTCLNFEQVAMPMVHPTTGKTISSYKRLMHDPAMAVTWQTAFGKDFGSMAQGDTKLGQRGMNLIFVVTHDKITHIPKHQTVAYAHVVVDFCLQKAKPHLIRITAGGNLINYPGELSTQTADLTTSKLMWNSVLSTEGAKYMCLNIKNFYLTDPLDRFEYMKMPLVLFPEWIKIQYELDKYTFNGFVYLKMRRAVWGLQEAGILANKLLRKRLLPHGYYECNNTPSLWKHRLRPIAFTLVDNNVGVKYVGKEHADHLIQCIKETYKLTEYWTGGFYCSIKLAWDYNTRTLDILMPGYIKKLLRKYKHQIPPQTATLPLFLLSKTIRGQRTSFHPNQYFPQIIARQNRGNTTNNWKHPQLRAGG